MKIKFCHDNNANIHSKRVSIFDIEKDLLITPGEWASMSEDEKNQIVCEWALQDFEYWYEEV